jgi:hypothetical protein
MKLSLKLANATLTFEVTGSVSIQYTDSGMEIIEAVNDTAVPVNTTIAPVPVVQKTCNTEPESVDTCSLAPITRLSSRCLANITDIIKNISTDSDILGVRKLLEHYLSDKQFNDIIAALDIYVHSIENASSVIDWNQRIRSLMCASMFILAGYAYHEVVVLLDGNPILGCINRQIYSNLKTGKPCKSYRVIAELLWPEFIHDKGERKWQRSHSAAEIQKFQQIVDALECGYSCKAVAKFTHTSLASIQSVRHNKSWANKYIEYGGMYPIGANVPVLAAAKKVDVHVCEECGCIIPAKRILAMPNAKYCVHCQTRKNEAYRQQFEN